MAENNYEKVCEKCGGKMKKIPHVQPRSFNTYRADFDLDMSASSVATTASVTPSSASPPFGIENTRIRDIWAHSEGAFDYGGGSREVSGILKSKEQPYGPTIQINLFRCQSCGHEKQSIE